MMMMMISFLEFLFGVKMQVMEKEDFREEEEKGQGALESFYMMTRRHGEPVSHVTSGAPT